MKNLFCKFPLWTVSKDLSAVAAGKVPADLVIRNVNLVNVTTCELLPHMDVAVAKGRIALVGDAPHCIGESTQVVDGTDKFLAPGFLDGHIHVESSMITVTQYAQAVLPHGTTGIFCDPHEICNVLGLKAVKLMADEGKTVPLKVMVTTPSCVPAVAGFEDIGSPTVTSVDVAETMDWDTVVGTGEMMNFPGMVNGLDEPHAIVGAALEAGKIPTGHYSIPETGAGLNGYIASGIRCCHESTRMEDALAKMRLGMYAQFREGSAWHDLRQLAPALTDGKLDSRFAHLVSDDSHPNTLVSHGHLNYILKRAVDEGIDPLVAVQMVTINVAQCFQLDHDFGSVTPGKCADMVLLEDLINFNVLKTWVDGDLVAENGAPIVHRDSPAYPDWVMDTVHVEQDITPEIFAIPALGQDTPTVRVMEMFGGQ
ncbi:MAG: amidohydrolase family protein, partial [Eubacteriales bacterium]